MTDGTGDDAAVPEVLPSQRHAPLTKYALHARPSAQPDLDSLGEARTTGAWKATTCLPCAG